MRWEPGKFQIGLDDWLRKEAFAVSSRASDDIHFDNLIGPWAHGRDPLELVDHCCGLLRQVVAVVPIYANLHNVRDVIVALPIRLSENIRMWKPRYWLKAGLRDHPPSLILNKDNRFHDRFDEEYYRKIALPIGNCPDVQSVFKSYRDLSGPGAMEFGNTVFLFVTVSAIA